MAIGALLTWKPEIIADRILLSVQKDSNNYSMPMHHIGTFTTEE